METRKATWSLSLLFVVMFIMMTCVSASNCKDEDDSGPSKVVEAAAVGVAAGTAASTIGTITGFGVAGIAKGSVAALVQSTVGTPVVFSALQSLGATGAFAVFGPVGVGVGAAAGAAYYLFG